MRRYASEKTPERPKPVNLAGEGEFAADIRRSRSILRDAREGATAEGYREIQRHGVARREAMK